MWRFLLDTNIASFLAKGLNANLQRRIRRVPRTQLVISSVTEAEMRFGLERLPSEAKVRVTVPKFLAAMESAPWDSFSARHYAVLAEAQRRAGKTLSLFDTMIAAHALALDLTLITNDKAFVQIKSLRVEDWTKGPQRP